MYTLKPPLGVPINWMHPLSQGLIACWIFNEGGGGKVCDLSGYGSHGTIHNMSFPPTPTSGWNTGRAGKMLAFDGTGDYIHVGTPSALTFVNTAFTVAVWVKWDAATANDNKGILGKYGTERGLAINTANTPARPQGGFDFLYQSIAGSFNSNEYIVTGSRVFDDGNWHLLCCTFEPSTETAIFVDAEMIVNKTTSVPASIASNSENIEIGSYNNNTMDFTGEMETVLVYNRALTQIDMMELYLNPYCFFALPVFNWYDAEPAVDKAIFFGANF